MGDVQLMVRFFQDSARKSVALVPDQHRQRRTESGLEQGGSAQMRVAHNW